MKKGTWLYFVRHSDTMKALWLPLSMKLALYYTLKWSSLCLVSTKLHNKVRIGKLTTWTCQTNKVDKRIITYEGKSIVMEAKGAIFSGQK